MSLFKNPIVLLQTNKEIWELSGTPAVINKNIAELFCLIDDFCNSVDKNFAQKLLLGKLELSVQFDRNLQLHVHVLKC